MVEKSTEDKIVDAAEKVFIEKGLAGARMQEIADEAGINKSLLHYYYRSKEKLFEMVFKMAFKRFVPNLIKSFEQPGDFEAKVRAFIGTYIDTIEKIPHIPVFILSELTNNPRRLVEIVKGLNVDLTPVLQTIQNEIDNKRIRPILPETLIVNVLALCIFPIVAKPMVQNLLLKGDQEKYRLMMSNRKEEVARFVLAAIQI